MKREDIRKPHVVETHRAIDTLSREEFLAAKYGGMEFTRPERSQPVNLIESPRIVEPLRFSLANLLPVGV